MAQKYFELTDGQVIETNGWSPTSDAKPVTVAAGKERVKQQAIETLKAWIKPGDTVWCILNHVSASGMSRRISLAIGGDDRSIIDLTYWVSQCTHYRMSPKSGLVVGGCGMDMGFAVVYDLSHTLFGDGYSIKHRWL